MRGFDDRSDELFSYVSKEDRLHRKYPLRLIREVVDDCLAGLSPDERVWDASTFSKNRDRLLEAEAASVLLAKIIAHPRVKRLLSKDHFTVDGTMIDAFASMKSFRRKDGEDDDPDPGGNGTRSFRGEKRSNKTHESKTDRDARLFRKGNGRESRLCYLGHALMENRNGLVVEAELTRANGHGGMRGGARHARQTSPVRCGQSRAADHPWRR